MSKRGSKNALRFAGKRWSLGSLKLNSPKKKKLNRKNSSKKMRQFSSICEKFNFEKNKDPLLYKELWEEFKKIKKYSERVKIVKNVPRYQKYCSINNTFFNIKSYFSDNYHLIDYSKEFPELFKVKETKNKNKNKNKKSILKGSSLSNFFSDKEIKEIKDKLK